MDEYIKNIDKDNVSMQTLAFIGDAVYNVYIRCYLASKCNAKSGKLHSMSINYVSAKSQSHTIDLLFDKLSNEEQDIWKRGRNTNINNVTKNVDVVEYKKATGFEALLGYLYLDKQIDRLEQIIQESVNIQESKGE